MTTNQIIGIEQTLFERYGRTEKLYNLPDSEFKTGGTFCVLAVAAGYSGGVAVANELNLWSATLEDALTVLHHPPEVHLVLRRKTDGWYVAPGGHTSDPASAVQIDSEESSVWLRTWGSEYELVDSASATEVD